MKKTILGIVVSCLLLTNLSALEKLEKSPIDKNFLSVENSGTLKAIDAYSDGVGMFIVDNSKKLDNSRMNNSTYAYGIKAKSEHKNLFEFMNIKKNNLSIIKDTSIVSKIGDHCDDGNFNTINDFYTDTNGTCEGSINRTENKCFGEQIGSEFYVNGVLHLVVDDDTIKDNLDRASSLCTSNVYQMDSLFDNNTSFNQDISSWDVSNVYIMVRMFYNATSFNQDISSWDVSNVIDMKDMFFNAKNFNQPLNNWNTSNVFYMDSMFENATKFNQPLNNWDTSNVLYMNSMFFNANNFNQNLSTWILNSTVKHSSFTSPNSIFGKNTDYLPKF
jgi:surface protein